MSEGNVEIVRTLYAAWQRRDAASALKYVDPNVEVDTSGFSGVPAAAAHGVEGMQAVIADWLEAFDSLEWAPENFIVAGDHVIVWLGAVGRPRRGGGAPITMKAAAVYTLRDGLLVGFRAYDTLSEAARSVNL